MINKPVSQRLLALDILRGITIAGMILVNNPGSWKNIYPPLEHAEWIGLTPTDLIFPFFMFIMGISTFISLRKFNFQPESATIRKIIKRTVLLYLVGLALAWFSLALRTWNAPENQTLALGERVWLSVWNFKNIRLLGVIPRLAICYGAVSMIAVTMKHKYIPYLIAVLLIGYWIALELGYGYADAQYNILSIVDRAVLGANHIYKSKMAMDPEGVLSSIPAVAHVLIGFMVGKMMYETQDIHEKIQRLFITGAILTFAGFLFSYVSPISKKIWTPTFVLATCGMAATFLALLIWIIDVKGYKKWCRFFEVFGINPLFMYVLGAFVAIVSGNIMVYPNGRRMNITGYIYTHILQPTFGDLNGSLIYALLFVVFIWSFGYVLYKKKIYIKL